MSGPTSAAIRASTCGDISRSWVAHAVDSAMHGQLGRLEPLRPAVRGDVRADDLLPSRQQPGRGEGAGPVPVTDQLTDGLAERRRVALVRAGAAPQLVDRRRLRRRRTGAGLARRARASSLRAASDGSARRPGGSADTDRPARRRCPSAHRLSCAGTSSATAAVISTCSAGATSSASDSRRPSSSSANTSSRTAPARRRRCAAGRRPRVAAPARTTTTRRGWHIPGPAARRARGPGRRGAGRPG